MPTISNLRFRIVLPLLYVSLVVMLILASAGHGKSAELIPVISIPTIQILEWLFGSPQTFGTGALFIGATAFQWFMVGYLIDTVLFRKR